MKFSVSSSELLKKLQTVNGAISPNPVLQILEGYLFEIVGNKLTISSTDMEVRINTQLDVRSDADGKVAIPSKILLDTLKQLPEQPLTFSIDPENFSIEITSSFGKYKIAGEDGEDFPEPASQDEVDSLQIDASKLSALISNTLFATSNDELRPSMVGVYFQVDMNDLTVVATDAHKLVKYKFDEMENNVTTSFIIPKKGLNLLKNALPNTGEVTVAFNQQQVFFQFENTTLDCRLIDARYPDYNAVIPYNNSYTLSVNRADFQSSLKRISNFANKTTNQVLLNINDKSLTISAQDLDFSNEATEQMSCSYDGEALTIGFNAKFLVEMLGVISSEEILFKLESPNKAGVILPSEEEENESLLMLLMPVMLSN